MGRSGTPPLPTASPARRYSNSAGPGKRATAAIVGMARTARTGWCAGASHAVRFHARYRQRLDDGQRFAEAAIKAAPRPLVERLGSESWAFYLSCYLPGHFALTHQLVRKDAHAGRKSLAALSGRSATNCDRGLQ